MYKVTIGTAYKTLLYIISKEPRGRHDKISPMADDVWSRKCSGHEI